MSNNNKETQTEEIVYTKEQKEIMRANFGGITKQKKVNVNNVVQEQEQEEKTEK